MNEGTMPAAPDANRNLFQPDQTAPLPPAGAPAALVPPPPSAPPAQPPAPAEPDAITWTASEFIAHQKSASWYGLLALAAVAIGTVVYLLTRDYFPTIAVISGVILLAVYAGRQPRQESYRLDQSGLTIGTRHYSFREFRSFAVAPEGAFSSIELTPLRRFAMYTNLYFDPADEARIVGRLSQHLSIEEPRSSLTDNLMRRIHF